MLIRSRLFFALISLVSLYCLAAPPVLRVLAWPGYADPDIVAGFEQKTGARVEVTLVDTDDALWEKAHANSGLNFDVMAINTAELQRFIDGDLVQDIPAGSVPNIAHQLSRFRNAEGIRRGDNRYAVPFTYSEMGLIYNKKLIATPPRSMSALWDVRQKGRIALHEGSNHNFSLTALTMGVADPFHLDQTQFREAVKRLIQLRANRPYFYSSPEQAVALFREHPIALMFGNYGSQQVQLLRQAGFDVGYVIPAEGALAWLDCWAVLRGANNPQLAQAWLNYMISPEVARQFSQRQGLANTLEPWPTIADKDKIFWLQPVENTQLRNQYWTRILSGARKGMF